MKKIASALYVLLLVLLLPLAGNQLGAHDRVAVGMNHSLVVRGDGTVWAWGSNSLGQLGTDTSTTIAGESYPVQVPGLTDVVSVSAGWYWSLALKSDGTVWAWGDHRTSYSSATPGTNAPVQVPGLTDVVQLSASCSFGSSVGSFFAFARKSDGTVWSWGADNSQGQLGWGVIGYGSWTPAQVVDLDDIIDIDAGGYHGIALKDDGTVWVWGRNGEYQTGIDQFGYRSSPVQVPGPSGITRVFAGGSHNFAINAYGYVLSWGSNLYGARGTGVTPGVSPAQVQLGSNFIQSIAAGTYHTLALTATGKVHVFGLNNSGQLGLDPVAYPTATLPIALSQPVNIVAVAADYQRSIFLAADGTIWTCGSNGYKNLGIEPPNIHPLALKEIPGIKQVDKIAAGTSHALVTDASGKVYGWGMNAAYQLGKGDVFSRSAPVSILQSVPGSPVAAAFSHSLSGGGSVGTGAWWGTNNFGVLPTNNTMTLPATGLSFGGASVVDMALGDNHSVVLTNSSAIWAWGRSNEGQLGRFATGTPISNYLLARSPGAVAGIANVTAVAASARATYALDASGDVWAWGLNSNGQLGNGLTTNVSTPQLTGVGVLSSIVQIAAGSSHALALKNDGTVWGWGGNAYGQTGVPVSSDVLTPVQIPGLVDIVRIGTGMDQSFAVKADNTVWSWGRNHRRQLGRDAADPKVPGQIEGLVGIKDIKGGEEFSFARKEDGTLVSWGAIDSMSAPVPSVLHGIGGERVEPEPILEFNADHAAPSVTFDVTSTVLGSSIGQVLNIPITYVSPDSTPLQSASLYYGKTVLATAGPGSTVIQFRPSTWGDFPVTLIARDQNGAYSNRATSLTIHVPFDSDTNGLPDWWELKHFAKLGVTPGGDPDRDGVTNLQEYKAGTDPLDAVNLVNVSGSSPSVTWSGNATGGNTGAGGATPGVATPLWEGVPIDASFINLTFPEHGAAVGEGMMREGQWGELQYHDRTQIWPGESIPDFRWQHWRLRRSADPLSDPLHAIYYPDNGGDYPLYFSMGATWDATGLDAAGPAWPASYYFGISPSAESWRNRPHDDVTYEGGVETTRIKWNDAWGTRGVDVRAKLEVPAVSWCYYYYNKYKLIKQDGTEVSRTFLGQERLVIEPGELASTHIELRPRPGDLLALGESEEIYLNPIDESGNPFPGFRISASDAAGPAHRKIGLHGMPLSDSKPQVKDESGEVPEETFVDAFTRQLNHSVSDVYASVDSSLLPLTVRRGSREHVWSLRSGLRPSELPDAPFGPGWSSNLCSHIKLEAGYRKAVVTDEQGAASVYFRVLRDEEGELHPDDVHVWMHTREEKQDARTVYNTFETLWDENQQVTGFVFRKKYGATCTYELVPIFQFFSNNRLEGSHDFMDYSYARLTKVEDRWGNQLIYSYPSDTTLIPNKIEDPDRPNQVVTITQNDGVVTAVRGPSGETIEYNYSTQNSGDDLVQYLSSVERGGHTVSYQYETEIEPIPAIDLDADGPPDPQHRHFSLTRITDERGGEYKFEYEFNHGNKYVEVSGDGFATRSQLGMPRLVKKVTLPNNAVTNFGGTRLLVCQSDATLGAVSMQTQVSGPCGTYTYTFTQPDVFVPLAQDPDRNPDPFSRQLTVFFSRMKIDTPEGDEVYNFDFDHGMALTSATDLSGNTTTFHYGTVGANGLGWDDPIQQVNALGKSRYFTYDNDTRVMKSMTDERGTLTSYTIQAGTGLRTKETISKGGSTLRVTDFDYGAGGFAGFLAKTTVQSTTATGGDLVTEYTPDANGRVRKEAVTAGGGIELVTSFTYTGNGSKKTVTNPRGHTTTFTYDAQSLRLTGVENPDSTTRSLGYDAHGNLTSEVNERGVTTTHEYDSLNRRKKSTVDMDDGADLVSETTYTALNLPHTETNPRGTVTTHTYDGIGRRLTTTVGSGGDAQTTTFTYGTNSGGSVFDLSGFKPTTITDPRGKVTTITYDDLYRPTVKQLPEGNTVTTTYDDAGNPEEVKDALNRITKTTFDGLNRPTKVEYPDATTRHSYYTPSGLVWKVVDELGRETLTQYDRAGRAVEVTLPEVNGVSPVTKTAYDANGNVIAAQDPLGNIITTVYDNRNRPTKVTSPYIWDALAGQWSRPEVNTTYDAGGNVLTVTDPLGKVTTNTYNNAGWVLTVTNALGQVTASTYDRNGNVKTVTDALNRVVTNTYDIHNRLIETEDAEEQITTFGYDKNGNRTSVTDPRGKVTTFTYDDLNRLLKETFQEGVWTERHYDAVRETSREDSAGREFTFGYDLRDRLTTTTWTVGGSPVVRTRVYDTAGRLTDVTETGRPEATVGYTYDALDRVATETSQGLTHTYTYDLGGRRTGTALGTGKTIATTYDSQGKPLTVTEGGRTTVYHYDLASRAVAQTQPNGLWQYNAYDDLGRLESRQTYTSTDALQAQFLWTYDAVGNVTVQSERWPGEGTRGAGWRSTVMVYDATNRLTGEAVAQPGSPVITTGYAYDTGSNRSVKLVSTDGTLTTKTLYTYNDFNQLTDWSEEDGLGAVTRTADLTYDLAGNRATQTLTVTGQAAETTTYHWDAENRLEGVTLPNADEHEYGYDYRTRRISRVESGIGTAIVFSGGLSVAEYESQGITPTVEYLRGPDMGGGVGGMMYSLRNGGTEAKYAMSNGRGDVVAQSNDAGALTWTASYEAYGKRPVETGTNLDRQRANTKEEDPTGLLNEGFRYRDIETGVWLSRDPAGFVDGPNLYAYVRQNPWTSFDPLGLNETLGWNNWFADWVLPDPVGSYKKAGEGLDTACGLNDDRQSVYDRIGGGFGYLGHGMSTVLDCIPVIGKTKSEIVKKLGKKGIEAAENTALQTSIKVGEQLTKVELNESDEQVAEGTALPTTLRQQKELARLTTAARNDLVNDFNMLLSELSPPKVDAIAAEPWRMRLFFGTAVESRVARQIGELVQSNPQSVLSGLHWTGRSNAPQDFIGGGGFGFDITGSSWNSVFGHQKRAAVDSVITYDSIPADFGFDFVNWLGGD